MEYISDRGSYTDLPLRLILETFAVAYPAIIERAAPVDDPAFAEPPVRRPATHHNRARPSGVIGAVARG